MSPTYHRHAIFTPGFKNDPQDIDGHYLRSPYKSPAQAHLFKTPTYSSQPLPIPADDEEGRIFLSSTSTASFTPLFTSSSSPTLLTPVKQPFGRIVLSDKRFNEPQLADEDTSSTRVGLGTKRKSTPQCTPLKIDTSRSFQRLAPLPAPKFSTRTPQSKAEADAFISKQTATLTRLRLTDKASLLAACADQDDDSDYEFDNVGGAALFRSATTGAHGRENEEVAEAVSPGGHIVKRRARTRPLSAELLSQQPFRSPSPVKKPLLHKSRPRHSGPVAFPSYTAYRSRTSPGSSSSEGGSPVPRRRISNVGSRPQIKPPVFTSRPPMSRQGNLSAATLFFGPSIPQSGAQHTARARTNTGGIVPDVPPKSQKAANRHSYAGTGSSGDWAHIPPPRVVSSLPNEPKDYVSTDEDEDMSFEGPAQSSFTFSLTGDTPSPSSKKVLPRKFQSVYASRSVQSGDTLSVMSGASSSVSSFGSDDGLITPLNPVPTPSGWSPPQVHDNDTDGYRIRFTDEETDVDEFIVRTLAAGAKGPGPGGKKPPGTPVKKARIAFLGPDRPWQSAVSSKIGLRDEPESKKAPRKSLPAAFPPMGSKGGKSLLDQCTDTEDEEDSPSAKKDGRYTSLGLGRPTGLFGGNRPLTNPKPRWLMRRSSSGAFSSSSESTSQINTPTRPRGIDWQLPKLNANLSPSRLSERSASGSSTSSVIVSSPTNRKNGSVHARPKMSLTSRRLSEPATASHPGRFERDFVTVDEVGSGEFGSVIKVRCKSGDDNEVYAIKRSKRFEGAKHRLRLWEEVEVLKHLSESAERSGLGGRHPNVLAYMDSWEEDEALFIQTELCESGNLARFLWEYGKVFPRLDEARVWKSVVDLINGLCFIHECGVIHLDLKPSNVFVTHDGRFKIGDFGMASLWPRQKSIETDGTEVATSFEREGDKLYLAPEVLQGRYSKAADMFSFGMTILETATNIVVPDQGESWHRLRREDFSQVEWDGSNALLDLIKATMRTDPERRVTAQEVHDHAVVARTRRKMEASYKQAKGNGTNVFAASPLAGVPRGFLEEILGDDDAMDVSC